MIVHLAEIPLSPDNHLNCPLILHHQVAMVILVEQEQTVLLRIHIERLGIQPVQTVWVQGCRLLVRLPILEEDTEVAHGTRARRG